LALLIVVVPGRPTAPVSCALAAMPCYQDEAPAAVADCCRMTVCSAGPATAVPVPVLVASPTPSASALPVPAPKLEEREPRRADLWNPPQCRDVVLRL